MTDAVPIHPRQGRMFASPAQLALEGAADAFHEAIGQRVDVMRAAAVDPLTVALFIAAASGVEVELRAMRPRPAAILGGVRLLRDLVADAAGDAGGPIRQGTPDDDQWLASLTRAAALRDPAHP